MRSRSRLRAATLTLISAGLVLTAGGTSPGPQIPAELADGGSACVGECPRPLTPGAEGWASVGQTYLPGGRVALGPGPVSGDSPAGNPTTAHANLDPVQVAQIVTPVVEAFRTPYADSDPRIASIAEGVYGGSTRPGLETLFAPKPSHGWIYGEDLPSTPVEIVAIEQSSAFPEAEVTMRATFPVVDRKTGEKGTMQVQRIIRASLLDSWILDWTVADDRIGQIVRATA